DRNVTGVQTCALPILSRKVTRAAGKMPALPGSARTERVTVPPAGVYLMALSRRLAKTCLMRAGSTEAVTGDEWRVTGDPASCDRSEERRVGKEGRAGW